LRAFNVHFNNQGGQCKQYRFTTMYDIYIKTADYLHFIWFALRCCPIVVATHILFGRPDILDGIILCARNRVRIERKSSYIVVENQLITRTAGKAQSEGAWPCRSVDEGRGGWSTTQVFMKHKGMMMLMDANKIITIMFHHLISI